MADRSFFVFYALSCLGDTFFVARCTGVVIRAARFPGRSVSQRNKRSRNERVRQSRERI
jgi:hypothetical protein